MRVFQLAVSVFLFFSQSSSQQTAPIVQRDPQAVAILQASLKAMGGTVPKDSVATGSIAIVAGSLTTNGTIRVLTRATRDTSEQLTIPGLTRTIIFSEGDAIQTENSTVTSFSMERAATSQSLCFPLPFLSGVLANGDESIRYIGAETLGQLAVQHLQMRNTYASTPKLQQVADPTVANIWLDSATGLPQKISVVRQDATGPAVPRFLLDYYFSNYQIVSGTYYPFQINISLNGTPWTTITISGVKFNTGLSESDFPVE
jgi:hypothetical protein